MNVEPCPACGVKVITCGGQTFEVEPGDLPQGRFPVYARHMLTVDREGTDFAIELNGPRLASARAHGVRLFRRHGITCEKWWEGQTRWRT